MFLSKPAVIKGPHLENNFCKVIVRSVRQETDNMRFSTYLEVRDCDISGVDVAHFQFALLKSSHGYD